MKLIKKKKISKRKCWDITVEKNSNFFANNICVHNSNAAIFYQLGDSTLYPQSRERQISLLKDNAGFAAYVKKNENFFLDWFERHCATNGWENLTLFGEWCGGSIQKGVALNKLEKRFVIFAAYINKGEPDEHGDDCGEYVDTSNMPAEGTPFENIADFKKYYISINLNDPGAALDEINSITEEVEKCCPYAKAKVAEILCEKIWTLKNINEIPGVALREQIKKILKSLGTSEPEIVIEI